MVVLPVVLAGCGGSGSSSGGGSSVKLALVAYSTPAEAYAQLIPAFQKTAAGKGVDFSQSYGASGDQSRAVDAGQKADFVHFALEPDVQRLVDDGKVAASWNQGANKGVLADSVTVFVVRSGNPKNIHTWADLIKPGVQVITANPFTSGGARWNVMAAYGAQLKLGKTPAQAVQYLYSLFKNVPVQDSSARDALATFTGGKGDVLLSYENEAILAKSKGESVDYVVPDQTILIQTVAAVTKTAPPAATAFLNYLWTPEAQKIFADNGYRPVVAGVTGKYTFPQPAQLYTIDDLGGWSTIKDKFFDPTKGIMAKVEQSIGVSTGG
ncbi:MAG: sulfate/thiosulfate transport system substrate-binding protein [Gaiellales bacterium]|jgi:sulfate transport system substrate-binding protein|nr:sulfate/thiosulfate transport system substrate-binding protein [Gaiellales bacterium]